MTGRQLALALELRPALGREDFLVAPGNAAALAWLDRWPNWPTVGLVIYGPPGCGKTHLAEVWRVRTGALRLDIASLDVACALRTAMAAAALVVEGGEGVANERALLHLYNAAVAQGASILLTGRAPPARWPLRLADLASRLRALPAVPVAPPDDETFAALLVKLLADRQLAADAAVIRYLTARLERSHRAAQEIVAALDGAALADRRAITVPLARHVLHDIACGG
ncbi:MAG: hypothetical protein FJX56_12935 [Alphaproteobacteria bacterium]|nr:hypothetical protein [Alphaproteobacteria bacterium]